MVYIRYSILIVIFCFFSSKLVCQEKNIEMVLKGPDKLTKKNMMAVRISFLNYSEDTVRLYHPGGEMFSAFGGYYVKYNKLYSLGILQNDTLQYWKGNCNMERAKQKIYISFENGITVIFPKWQERLKNSLLSIKPLNSISFVILVDLTDCYQFENNRKYTLSITYNHPFDLNDISLEDQNRGTNNFLYTSTSSLEFVYIDE